MKRISFILLSLWLLISFGAKAQTQDSTIAIPNPSFENWSTGSGYSVAMVIQVYGSYTYPTSWNIPTYPVNQTVSYFTINTNLPLIKITNVTSGAVNGSHALKMESFMLSDIIGSTVYNMAASSLDPMMTSSVFPTILSTGEVDVMEFLPMMYDITSNFGNLSQMLSLLDEVDINTLIDGGIPLNGNIPGRMTGYYKYTSAPGGDNGGILMLGTKYNTATHKREVVGAGYTVSLTDASTYTPFELTYSPLSQITPGTPYVEADSLVIFLFSSANANPRQGSALFLDNLQLFTGVPPQPDTCSAVFNLSVDAVDTTHVFTSWTYEGDPDHFQVELGPQGFRHGQGMQITVFDSLFSINGLQPDTWYDLYVRCVCDNDLYGEWAVVTFHTDTLIPPVIIPDDTCSAVFNLHLIDVDTMHATIGWSFEGDPDHFEAEYGVQGFAQGNGTTVGATESFLHLSNLQPDTYYDVYVRCVCDEELFGEWAMMSFHTDTLVPPAVNPGDTTGGDTTSIQRFAANMLTVYPNPAHGQCVVSFAGELPQTVKLYTLDGKLIQETIPTKETIELTFPTTGIFILNCEMREGTLTRKIVNQ